MIYRNMEQLGVFPSSAVLKVGDTVPDIEAGRNAGVRTVGITRTGSEVGLTEAEFNGLEADEASERVSKAEAVFQKVYTEFILASVAELPSLLDSESL